ncbi:hypothetical protein FB459_1903 [Yimella lutea]|uniref:Uncharacterized protein n=2 Tax=Yimella lutea TaxID=587872 RepID=A0A542EGH5_9MICO|nr:hypothetical protein FB459_1903 [Yimella lutea]
MPSGAATCVTPESVRGDIRCSVDLLDALDGSPQPRATMAPCAIEKLKELAAAGHYAD